MEAKPPDPGNKMIAPGYQMPPFIHDLAQVNQPVKPADGVHKRLQADEKERKASTTMLIDEAHQPTLSITHIEIIPVTGTDDNSVKTEIKEEPLSPQCIEESETDIPACALHLKKEESENDGKILVDMDIESQTLTEIDKDLNVCIPIENVKTEEMRHEGNITPKAEIINWKEYEGAMSVKCEQTPAENKEHIMNLTPGRKNITENLTRLDIDVGDSSNKHLTNMFICNDCGDMFSEKYLLIEHIKLHDVNTSSHVGNKDIVTHGKDDYFDCEICRRKFAQRGYSKTHMRIHTGEKPFECVICYARFTQQSILKTHLRTHTGEKPFECEICKFRFRQKGGLQAHLRTHTGEKPFECNICHARFAQQCVLKTHLRTHTGEKPFECGICKVRFRQKGGLQSHLRTHSNEKPFKCEICKVGITTKSSLKIHLRRHTGEKPFECDICKLRFNQKSGLKMHMKTHTGEKRYECVICKCRFRIKGSLQSHLRTHTGEKPYECEICKVRFTVKCNLRRHLLTHNNEKPFQCELCKFRFTQKGSLKAHLRIHTGEKPFECTICDARFNQKRCLNIHLNRHTQENPSHARGRRRRGILPNENSLK